MPRLHERYGFDKRGEVDDGYGNVVSGPWVEQFETRGARRFFRGVEKAQDAASTSMQKMIITVRSFADARSVTPAWRVVDKRSGETYNVLAVEPNQDRLFIDFIVQSGGADG
jgi:hypothetical protein